MNMSKQEFCSLNFKDWLKIIRNDPEINDWDTLFALAPRNFGQLMKYVEGMTLPPRPDAALRHAFPEDIDIIIDTPPLVLEAGTRLAGWFEAPRDESGIGAKWKGWNALLFSVEGGLSFLNLYPALALEIGLDSNLVIGNDGIFGFPGGRAGLKVGIERSPEQDILLVVSSNPPTSLPEECEKKGKELKLPEVREWTKTWLGAEIAAGRAEIARLPYRVMQG